MKWCAACIVHLRWWTPCKLYQVSDTIQVPFLSWCMHCCHAIKRWFWSWKSRVLCQPHDAVYLPLLSWKKHEIVLLSHFATFWTGYHARWYILIALQKESSGRKGKKMSSLNLAFAGRFSMNCLPSLPFRKQLWIHCTEKQMFYLLCTEGLFRCYPR